MNPRYPVYVISKGRWKTRMTSRVLEKMRVPYRIVVEPQEREAYESVIDPSKVLVLPFSNLGKGSIPARNWVWEHSISEGWERHWILDDNIREFYRWNRNHQFPVRTGAIFRAAEDFSERYENVALSGFNYYMFAPRKDGSTPAFYRNTRIYSCILILNSIDYRWRGKYNEDTDLSIRVLKDGWCTVLFNAFLAHKMTTMTMKGGNTDELYAGDGRRRMAESLVEQHPDVARVSFKWNRVQHHVDYRRFSRTRLRLRQDVQVLGGVYEYGMVLRQRVDKRWKIIDDEWADG